MLYIGKFINNFKDFYNEINSATLTGAIDVIVVRQPDGSYMCSPFHVRFGKIGVLRSREKVVDIEVNGSPIHIHMKLGESGEAFFVEEVDGENEIPSYLATSPLPDVPNIESELEKMRLSTFFNEESKALSREPCTVNSHFNETESVLNSSSLLGKTDCDKIVSNISSKDTRVTESNKLESNVPNIEETITSGTANNTVNTDSSDEVKTKRKRRKKIAMKKRSKTKDSSVISSSKPINILRHSDILPKEEDLDDKLEEIFQMDDDYADGDAESSKSSGGLSRSVSLPVSANLDDLFKTEWTSRKASTTFTGEFHPFSDGDVTPQSSPVVSRPPSPKSDTEYENQKIDTVTPTDSSAPSWGWGQLPNVPRKISEAQAPSGISADAKNESEQNKDDDSAVDAEKRSMLGGVLNFMRSTKKIRHMPESEGIYLSDLNAEELDPELAALYFPKFKSPYGPPNDQVKDEDTESGKGPSLPHSPHTVEGCYVPGQDSDSDGGISSDQFSKEKCETISYPYSDIAMSLCGGLQDPEIELPEERFLHSLVTFDEFTENPAILQDPNLVIRIGGKYYNWPTAASMLTSIIMFQRPLPEKTANQLINEHMPKKKKSKSYSSWWSWRRADTEIKPETDASPTQLITDASLLSEGMESKIGSAPEEKSYEMEVETCIAVTVEQTVKETVATVTEVVSEVHDVLIEKSEAVTLQEVIVEPPSPCIEPEVNLISPSSESSTSFTSPPIEINTSTREWSDNSNLLTPEIVAQIPSSAKENDSDKTQNKEKYKKSLRLTSEQIAKLNLQEGPNEFVFSVTTAYQGTTKCTCQVFLWNYDDKIVISDIDGTITKSDVLGHILPMVGHSWAQLGVAKLFTKIQDNGYKFLYLSARAIGQARITREYLRRLRQGEICLPDGPLLLSPTSLISALHREVIERKPEEFKISCLKDIQTLFPTFMGNPFYAGFGNKINDTWAYRAVGIPITRVFTINHRGELKLELIQTFQSSYTRLSDEVDHVFPPLKPSTRVNGHPMPIFSSPEEFSYFTYWRDPVPLLSADDMVV